MLRAGGVGLHGAASVRAVGAAGGRRRAPRHLRAVASRTSTSTERTTSASCCRRATRAAGGRTQPRPRTAHARRRAERPHASVSGSGECASRADVREDVRKLGRERAAIELRSAATTPGRVRGEPIPGLEDQGGPMTTEAISEAVPARTAASDRADLALVALIVGGLRRGGGRRADVERQLREGVARAQRAALPRAPGTPATCPGDGGALLASVIVDASSTVANDVVSRLSPATRALLHSAVEQSAITRTRPEPRTPRRSQRTVPPRTGGLRRGDERSPGRRRGRAARDG